MGINRQPPAVDEFEVSLFGPGTGECIVAHIGAGDWMVVDSCSVKGSKEPVALRYLSEIGVPYEQVKVIVITHFHDDHIKGIGAVIAACPNATIWVSNALIQEESIAYILAHKADDVISDKEKASAHEINALVELMQKNGRDFYWAMADRAIYRNNKVVVNALSPSDRAVSQSRIDFAKAFAETGTGFRKLAKRLTPNLCAILKKCEPYLRFVFLTGITKFSQLSIFSELNNITNVSMDDEYAGICGITKEELLTQMSADIDALGEKIGKTREETIAALTNYYDGYHFSGVSPDIFNPFSLLNAMAKGKLDYYWFTSGTPTYLINMMKKFDTAYTDFAEGMEADASDFDAPTDADIMTTITPLLYQSGYITIKGYDKEYDSYFLGIPNKEVRLGLTKALIPYYVTPNTVATNNTVRNMARALNKEDMNLALQHLQTFLGTVPYCDNTNYEGHYQQMLFVIFTLLSAYMVDVEVRTQKGRVDMVLRSKTHLYLLELKLNQSSDVALKQIDLKEYPKRFALCGLPIVKVGINFDMATHSIIDWKIEK